MYDQVATGLTPTHTYATPGPYPVRFTADLSTGCPVAASLLLLVAPARNFQYPNIITPNGDGANNDFRPYMSVELVALQIFNRWGHSIYEQQDYGKGWNLDFNVAAGLYYYQLSSASGQKWTGWR